MNKKVFLLIGILIILVLVVGVFIFRKNSFENGNSTNENVLNFEENQTSGAVVSLVTSTEELPLFQDFETDHDRDGVDDTREKEMGLNISQFDTDGDGLSDANEIENFKTDPKNKDTDKDGFADGYEVLNGFDPNGSGKLPGSVQ